MRLFASKTDHTLRAALDGLTARQRAIQSNLANADTPGFKLIEVDFETALQKLSDRSDRSGRGRLDRRDAGHFGDGARVDATASPISFHTRPTSSTRMDGNNVDIDLEMARLAETASVYSALIQINASRLGVLRSAVTEGRR